MLLLGFFHSICVQVCFNLMVWIYISGKFKVYNINQNRLLAQLPLDTAIFHAYYFKLKLFSVRFTMETLLNRILMGLLVPVFSLCLCWIQRYSNGLQKLHQTSNVIRSSSEKLVLTIKIASTQSLIINSKRGIVVGILLNFTDSLCSSSIACRRLVAPISEQIGLFIKFHSKMNFEYYTFCWFDKWSLSLPLSVSKQCGVYLITGTSMIKGRWHVIYHLRTVFITRCSFTACTQNKCKRGNIEQLHKLLRQGVSGISKAPKWVKGNRESPRKLWFLEPFIFHTIFSD